MIIRQSADTLEQVLQNAVDSGVTEIVLVDTEPGGSQDGTKEIAATFNAKLILEPWEDNFAKHRNTAFENLTTDWYIWLDSDDVVPELTQQTIKQMLLDETLEQFNGFFLPYQMFKSYDSDQSSCTFPRERIIAAKAFKGGSRWEYEIHECVPLQQPTAAIEQPIHHRPRPGKFKTPKRNLKILQRLYDSGDRQPRMIFYYARELYWNKMYNKAIKMFNEWMPTKPCDWELYSGMLDLADCYVLSGKEDKARETIMKLLMDQPERAEAWMKMGILHYSKKDYGKALPFFKAAQGLRKPDKGFVDENAYGIQAWDYLACSFGWCGYYQEARQITEQVLIPNSQGKELVRHLDNLKMYVQKMEEL